MRVSAFYFTDYGTLKGTVSQISEDAIKTQNNRNDAVQNLLPVYYQVDALLTLHFITLASDKLRFYTFGMLPSKEESILQFLLRKFKLIVDI